ncbi:MAG: hypothetical protein ACLFQK_06215 [Fibrobacterota bacterium]
MKLMIYTILCMGVLKLILDNAFGHSIMLYSVIAENVIFILILILVVRTYMKQKVGRREELEKMIKQLSNKLMQDNAEMK